ncbi:MAG: dihydroorotate dehydrogenase electron transfer subunit [Deltaproteobacteria bacterium]|nr:dihydroorotate dehydrogenase electron transfer subunit [Deltaproteobacteria bacterium]
MRYFQTRVSENRSLEGGYFVLTLSGCEALKASKPGQFVMVRGEWERDPLLPRAFSLMTVGGDGTAEILAKVVGTGTSLLSRAALGETVQVLGPLGHGFPEPSVDCFDLLVAGGVGLPPLLMQAEAAAAAGLASQSELLYGGRRAVDIVLGERLLQIGTAIHISTEDGSKGHKGRITEVLLQRLQAAKKLGKKVRILSCGPNPMLHAVGAIAEAEGIESHLSLEEVMACGIGVCLGCAIPAKSRPFRYVCKDGPVFDGADLVYETKLKIGT